MDSANRGSCYNCSAPPHPPPVAEVSEPVEEQQTTEAAQTTEPVQIKTAEVPVTQNVEVTPSQTQETERKAEKRAASIHPQA
jgi:hypothetical protein